MPKIKVRGLETNYIQFGELSNQKPIVIFIHGAAQSSDSWEYQFDFCKSYSRFSSIVIDLPGHGGSEGAGFTSIKEYSDFLFEFIKKLGIKNIILAGHSMGGRISQVFSLSCPDNILGVILAGTGARIRVARATLDTAKSDFKEFYEMATRNSFSESATKELRENFKRRLSISSQQTCVNDLIACNEFNVTSNVSEIKAPALIIAGKDDVLAPVKHSEYLRKNIPDSRLEIIEDAGHFMMQEKPNEFNKLIGKFLDFL